MNQLKEKRCLLILEFGIPHYRKFLYQFFQHLFKEFKIIHSGEIFADDPDFENRKCYNLKLLKGISLCFFNIFQLRKYDIIISTLNFRKPHTWVPFFIFFKKDWIFWGQGPGKSRNLILRLLRKVIVNNSLGYVTYTENGKWSLIKNGIHEQKISVAYNTLKINNSALTSGDNNYLLYVGRIQPRKGLMKVLQAITGTNHQLVIVGEGEHLKILNELIELNGLTSQVTVFTSIYEEERLKDIFSNAVAYISPDHVGLGVVHSFAYGVPVITCKNRKHAPEFEYCNDSNSFLYENDSELKSIITNVFRDTEARNKKSRCAYDYYKEFLDFKNAYAAFNYHFNNMIK